MNAMIATSITNVTTSVSHSHRKKWPIRGSAKVGLKSWPNAVTSVKNSSPKPMKMNQCPAPTQCHCSIRVWPSDSLSMVAVRRPGLSLRAAGCPTFSTAMIWRMALTKRAVPTAAIASETTMAKICMDYCSSSGRLRRSSVHRRVARA